MFQRLTARRVVAEFVVAAMLAVVAVPAQAATVTANPRVVLAVDGTLESRNLPVLLAERLGYFIAEGLTVTLVDSPAVPTPGELMRDGRADGAVAFFHHTFMSQADDRLVTEAVLTMGVTPALKLLVASRLRDRVHGLADLKGLRIYTGGTNSGKTTSANWLMERGALGSHDYTPLAPVGREAMERALVTGEADAIVSHEPDAALFVESKSAFVLADLSSPAGTRRALGQLYPSTALYMPEAYVGTHPQVVQHLVNACLRAMQFVQTHDAQAIAAVLPPKAGGKDRARFLRALAEDKQMFDTDGAMPAAGAREEWNVMSALQPKYRPIDFAKTYTDAFVKSSSIKVVSPGKTKT